MHRQILLSAHRALLLISLCIIGFLIIAQHTLTTVIAVKAPGAAAAHFCELLFYLNDCTQHAVFNQWQGAGAQGNAGGQVRLAM